MAARKASSSSSEQASLFGAPAVATPHPEPTRAPTIVELPRSVANDEEPPAPPVRELERKSDGVSVVMHVSGQWLVSRLRDDGTTYAEVFYTRRELELLRDEVARALA